jgi:hypothetical protein
VILYRSTKQPKYEALLSHKKRKHDAAAAANLEEDMGVTQGVVDGVVGEAAGSRTAF